MKHVKYVWILIAISVQSSKSNDLNLGDSDDDTCLASGCFDESPQCEEIARNGSCLGDALGTSRVVVAKKIFQISKNLLTCRSSCLRAFVENKHRLTESDIDAFFEASGLGYYMQDPFGVSYHLCDHQLGFTLTARTQFFNAQLNSVRSLFMPKFQSRQYTKVGMKKSKIPRRLYQEIMAFRNESLVMEKWQNDPYCFDGLGFCSEILDDSENEECRLNKINTQKYYNLPDDFAIKISETIRPEVEAWASELNLARGKPLLKMVGASERGTGGLTGMRRYGEKSWLSSHIDSFDDQMAGAVLHLAHETETPWPLHIYDYEGTHRRILLEPGDMFMFEGCRLPHGRVEMLTKGWYDNIFVHYRHIKQ